MDGWGSTGLTNGLFGFMLGLSLGGLLVLAAFAAML